MKKTLSMITVKFQKEGYHNYPLALECEKLKNVNFSGYIHRHIFYFEVSIQVFSDDRDIEFILFKRWLESLFTSDILNLNYKSCEMICDDLAEKINEKYPNRFLKISVFEDNENGATTHYEP